MSFPYPCQICPMKFENEIDLVTHTQVHSKSSSHFGVYSDSISTTNVLFPELDTMFFSSNMYYCNRSEISSIHIEVPTAEKNETDSSNYFPIKDENFYSTLSNMEIPYEPPKSVVLGIENSKNQRKKNNGKQKMRLNRSKKHFEQKFGLRKMCSTNFTYLNQQDRLSIKDRKLAGQDNIQISLPPALMGASSAVVMRKIIISPKELLQKNYLNKEKVNSVLTNSDANEAIRIKLIRKTKQRKCIEKKPYYCDLCDRSFEFFSNLLCHKQIHTTVKLYRCYLCKKEFGFSYMLTQHMRLHSEQVPYKCVTCKKIYRRVENLKQHRCIIRKSKKRPHSCPVCKRTFTRINYMNLHKRCHSKPTNCQEFQNQSHLQDTGEFKQLEYLTNTSLNNTKPEVFSFPDLN